MMREVVTISRISKDHQTLDLACGHALTTDDDDVRQFQIEALKQRLPLQVDCKLCENLIYRLHTRADIRRNIPNRKSVQEGQPDRIADLLDEAAQAVAECLIALQPFAECIEQINPEEDDEEWAKFRLLIKNYRLAAATFKKLSPTTQGGEHPPEQPG